MQTNESASSEENLVLEDWTAPLLEVLSASEAGNAFTQAVDDGPFTRS